MFQHAKTNNLPGLMLQIDFSKAFDSISFKFIENTLKFFGLSPKYIHWINSLLQNFQSSILINGFPTPRIKVGRGCRQGDPIAGYLFIICIELLLLKLASSKKIIPWSSSHNHKKLIDAYADDINMFLKFCNPQTQLLEILNILEKFRKLSGLRTNVSKTKYALFGNAIDSPDISSNTKITCETEPFRLLGIYLNGNLDKLDINWEKAIKAIKTEIGLWSTMKLTTTAKINITKTCLLSKITHFATILPLPKPSITKEVEQTICRFINGRRNKYKKEIIFTPTHAGGLGIPTLIEHWSSLQCSWLKRTHMSSDIWKTLLNPRMLDPILFLANPPSKAQMIKMDNPFWSQVLERWKQILLDIPKNVSCKYENICEISLISQQFPPNKNIPIYYITDENFNILPPSQLKQRLPEINWSNVSINLLNIATRNLRTKCKRLATYNGNFLPAADPILLTTLPYKKGCKDLTNTLFPKTFNPRHWGTLEKFSTDHQVPQTQIEKQIKKLARTSRIPEAKDLQYQILRNTCITKATQMESKGLPHVWPLQEPLPRFNTQIL